MSRPGLRLALLVAVLALVCATNALCLADDKRIPPASVPIEKWLAGPDRQDFLWKVQVVQTVTLQQRHLIQLLITIRGQDLLKGVTLRELHVVTKVADEQGNWLEGQSYSHFVPTADFTRHDTLHSFSNLYLQPGNYTVALIAYDSLHAAGNLWRTRLTVAQPGEPLADLGRSFPKVEFLPEAILAPALKEHAPWSLFKPSDLARYALDPLALGHGTADLPVANKRPIRIDVVVNVTDNYEVLSQRQEPEWNYRYNEGLALQVGNLFSQLAPNAGCVRLSVLNLLRRDLIVDRLDSRKVDWDDISKKIASTDLNKINVASLREKETAIWFKQFIERVNEDDYTCGLASGIPDHVIVVVSRAQSFPLRAHIQAVKPYLPMPRCYFIEFMAKNLSVNWDDVETVLKPMNPKRLRFDDPDSLRRQLNAVIKELSELSEVRPSQVLCDIRGARFEI
jgi:hypothetical protein